MTALKSNCSCCVSVRSIQWRIASKHKSEDWTGGEESKGVIFLSSSFFLTQEAIVVCFLKLDCDYSQGLTSHCLYDLLCDVISVCFHKHFYFLGSFVWYDAKAFKCLTIIRAILHNFFHFFVLCSLAFFSPPPGACWGGWWKHTWFLRLPDESRWIPDRGSCFPRSAASLV